jgi:uncharacterized membrane protein YgdD (TMEM256/DUF423 family)
MIRQLTLLAGLALLTLGTSAGAATTITFESFAGGTSFSGSGVTITASGQNILATASPNGSIGILADGTPRSEFTATFDILTNSVSVDLGDFGGDADTIYLDAFDLGDNFLGEASLLLSASDSSMHTLIFNGAGISYVVFGSDVPSINGSSVYADNLTFNSPSPVPEPSSWAMMLVGLGALGVHLRRQRRRWQAQVLST